MPTFAALHLATTWPSSSETKRTRLIVLHHIGREILDRSTLKSPFGATHIGNAIRISCGESSVSIAASLASRVFRPAERNSAAVIKVIEIHSGGSLR